MSDRPPDAGEVFSFASARGRVYTVAYLLIFGPALIAAAVGLESPFWFLAPPAAIVLAVALWRAAHIGIDLRSDAITVRNVFRTHELRWANVDFVDIVVGIDFPDTIAFRTRSGRRFAVEATATAGATGKRELLRQLHRYAEPHGVQFHPDLEV
jgi:hypothetical protein